jgi:hypothetical protein
VNALHGCENVRRSEKIKINPNNETSSEKKKRRETFNTHETTKKCQALTLSADAAVQPTSFGVHRVQAASW